MRLGIDFGTTRTVIAAARQGRYPVASFNTGEDFVEYLPGVASLDPDGLRLGSEVEEARPGALGGLVRSVKDTISGAAPDETVGRLKDSGLSALELTTRYLEYVKRMLLSSSNLEIDPDEPLEAMVAVPAHASTRQRYLTLEAFSRAGFSVLGLINEPTAAAIEFAKHSLSVLSPRSPKRYVVVYDLGGGTFDTAAVSLRERRFELIGAEGISHLGGGDFDGLIADHALSACGLSREDVGGTSMAHLLERCRLGKESLGSHSRKLMVDVAGVLPGDPSELLLDVGPIYDAAAPLISKTIAQVEQLMAQLSAYGIDPESGRELGAVYLVGGSIQFPAVQRALRKRFSRKVQLSPQPHATTAIGLAVAADDEAGIFVREAPTRHFGVWREMDEGREKVFDPLIERQTRAAPDGKVKVSRSYYPAHTVGLLRFVECTNLDPSLQPTGEVTPWENILFPYTPELTGEQDLSRHLGRTAGVLGQEIVETYEYEPSGIIRVDIENRTSGYRRSYVLGQAGG